MAVQQRRPYIIIPNDGYTWLKYGEKTLARVKGISRAYFRCARSRTTNPCPAKKTVDFDPENPDTHAPAIIYQGEHNHLPDYPLSGSEPVPCGSDVDNVVVKDTTGSAESLVEPAAPRAEPCCKSVSKSLSQGAELFPLSLLAPAGHKTLEAHQESQGRGPGPSSPPKTAADRRFPAELESSHRVKAEWLCDEDLLVERKQGCLYDMLADPASQLKRRKRGGHMAAANVLKQDSGGETRAEEQLLPGQALLYACSTQNITAGGSFAAPYVADTQPLPALGEADACTSATRHLQEGTCDCDEAQFINVREGDSGLIEIFSSQNGEFSTRVESTGH